MGKKQAGENTKKAAGNAKKVEVAAQKAAAENAKKAAAEDAQWAKGAKSNAKKEEAEAKKADAARKKAEKDALLAAEEKDAPSKPKGAGAKSAQKKFANVTSTATTSRGLDLSELDSTAESDAATKKQAALNASGIENALDALSLTANASEKVDRHPERRFKAAYAAYEARRLPELEEEQKGLRRQQRVDIVRKEFEKSPENPFNQANARFDSTRGEVREIRDREREKVEARLVER
ncbi:MAG: hypothetical protein Q9214_005514 [Letrouitia sp. 1 TL-2023]